MDNTGMLNRSRKPKLPDPNLTAFGVIQAIVGEPTPQTTPPPVDGKDPAAVALGRKGGLKGGKARAVKMTQEQRVAAARKAANVRWGK